MSNTPSWFNESEYADFLTESILLWELNIPYQKQKFENRKKIANFDRETAIRKGRLKAELARDLYQAKAKGLQMRESMFGDKIQQINDAFLNSLLSEAESKRTALKREKQKMRPEVDSKDRERDRKREARKQEKQAGLANVVIVKNTKLNKIEIITKHDYNPNHHTLLKGKTKKQDKGNVTKRDLTYYSSLDNFMNTKTSIRLLGGRVEREKEETTKQNKSKQMQPKQSEKTETPTPPHLRTPKDGKEMTNPDSTFPEWDHTVPQFVAGVGDALNSLSGKQPSTEYQQFINTSRTFGDAMQRFAKEIYSAFPAAATMTFTKSDPVVKTTKVWSQMGVKESAPAATVIGKTKGQSLGVCIKIGEEIRPISKGEAGIIFNAINAMMPLQQIVGSFDMFVNDFIQQLRQTFSSQSIPLALQNSREGSIALAREKWRAETTQNSQKTLLNRAGELVENYINENYDLKAAILLEALTGNIKFGGKTGSAQMMFTAKKDGTNAKAIPLDQNFALTLAKSKDTNLILKFIQTPNSSGGFLQTLFQKMTPLMENTLSVIGDIESIKNQINTPAAFLQAFELGISDATFKMPIEYSDFYAGDNDASNTIIFNANTNSEEQIQIPVQKNYDPEGNEQNVLEKGADALLEQYILLNDSLIENIKAGNIDMLDALIIMENEFGLTEARNYRKEYDNYHSKPEQRANRSKRVLARRKMEKKGKVRKGDGKDVDHKDGNPKNNGDSNLRVLPKSKNRSMNEDHGAGFEGTPEVVEKLLKDTPGSNFPFVGRASIPYLEVQLKKKKNKK